MSAGYHVDLAADFDDARNRLNASSHDLLVADVKLGAYNGLHLAILTRGRSLATRTLLIGDSDRVLQREAERERAVYLTPPLNEQAFLAAVSGILGAHSPARRSPRRRVLLDATVDGVLGSIVDLSYDGLCLSLPNADRVSLPAFFTLCVPAFGFACRVKRVWTERPPRPRGTLLCGAILPGPDMQGATSWRSFVDALPSGDSVGASGR
jgi:CheY-like chemotaxis protein